MTVVRKLLQIEVQGINKVSGPLGSAGSALVGLMGVATGAGAALAIAGAALIGVGVAAVAAAAKVWDYVEDCVEAATVFESQMAILDVAAKRLDLTVTDLAGETLVGLHDIMLQVGLDTRLFGVDAVEATDATTVFVKAGLSEIEMFGDLQGYIAGTSELSGGLRAAIDLATASELDHEEAARFASIALATYGTEIGTATERALFMNEAVDYTVRAADASTASVTGLTQGLEAFGPVANMFGIGIEDSNTLLAILSDRGIEGAEAGTALRSMFGNLTRDTAAVNEMYEKYNISLYDANGEMLSAQEIIGEFETAVVGLTEEEKHLLIQTTAGRYGQRALNALLIEGTEGWDEMTGKIEGASSVSEIAAARIDTLAGDQEILGGQMQTTSIIVGEKFIPIWREMTQWFSKVMEEHGPAIMTIFDGIATGVGILADIVTGPLDEAFGQLLEALGLTEEGGGSTAMALGLILTKVIELTAGGVLNALVDSVNLLASGIRLAKTLMDAFDGALRKVSDMLVWMKDRIWDAINAFNNLNLPSWLTPGSATPLELGLLGISKAFATLPDLPEMGGLMGPAAVMGGGGTQAGVVQITNYFGRDSVRSDADIRRIADDQQRMFELQGLRARIM